MIFFLTVLYEIAVDDTVYTTVNLTPVTCSRRILTS